MENPYQTPRSAVAGPTTAEPAEYSPAACPGCGEPVTFLVALRQSVPFYFRCGKCRRRYRVHAPALVGISFAILGAFALVAMLAVVGVRWTGALTAWLAPAMIFLYFALEWFTHWYIQRFGRLVDVDSGQAVEPRP